MKTSNVVLSLLFGAFAAAVPLDKRALVTKTNVVVETVVVFTTVWDGQAATTAAPVTSSAPGAFYEQPSTRSRRSRTRRPRPSTAVAPSTSVYVPQETSVAPPPPPPSSETPVVSSVYVPPPPPSTTKAPESTYEAPVPTPSTTEAPPPPPSTTETPAPPPSTTQAAPPTNTGSGSGTGEVHSGGSMTMNYFGGGLGACGDPVNDTDMAVALASDLYGASVYDVQTGAATNKWCNAKVIITYNGKSTNAVIKDKCPGCTDGGFDMTPSLWEAVTGGVGGASGDRMTGMTWELAA